MTFDPIAARQLDLGPAGFFRAEPENPPGNQVVVKAGFLYAGAFRVYDRFTAGDQTTAGFASVSGAGFKRYDLVYMDATGVASIAMGTEVALAAPVYQGAPGFTGGPDLPDQIIPVAYVLITEVGAVTVAIQDITGIAGVFYLSRNLDGFLVDKGLLGAAPTGANDIVTAMFVGETPGGSDTVRGVVTSPPGNYVGLLDQNGDELLHATTPGSRIYGRITEAATVWTLSYFYLSATGVETAVVAIETETEGGAPTNLRLVATPKVFSRNDPARPLFNSTAYRTSDQVVGDIPSATTTIQGKVELATDGEVAASVVVQGNDARLEGPQVRRNTAGSTFRRHRLNLIEGTNITIAIADDAGSDEVDITITAAGIGTYRARSSGHSFATAATLSAAPVDGIAYTPRLAIQMGSIPGPFITIGFAVSASIEAGWNDAGATSAVSLTDFIIASADTWNISTFTSTTVDATHTAGAAVWTGIFFITGDA